jgi:hypothetical protein
MALPPVFELWAECADKAANQRFSDHFNGLQKTLLSGRCVRWGAHPENHYGDGVSVWSSDLRQWGGWSLQRTLELTEAALWLYHHLLSAPDFRYAHIGVVAANYPMSDLVEQISPTSSGQGYLQLECVMDEALSCGLGRPGELRPFRQGYVWNGYSDEYYAPLKAADQSSLGYLRKALLPE